MLKHSLQYLRQFDKNLWILSIGWLVSAVGFAASLPFIAIYFNHEFGLSMTEIGLFFALLAVVRSVFQLVGGEISDRMARRSVLVYSQHARAAAFLGLAAAIYLDWGFWWVAIFLMINSVFGAVFQPAANAMVADILPQKQRLDGYAITRAAGNLGWALGPAIGGFLATSSYALLFVISAGLTMLSGLIVQLWLASPATNKATDRFRFKDILAIKDDPNLAIHLTLMMVLYLVVAQLIVPFSVYSVNTVGLSETQLGYLFSLNGLLVVLLQIPVTRLLARYTLTAQLAAGSLLYLIGYGSMGIFVGFGYFALAFTVITVGEVFMSPPALTLTSRLAPEGRMGRYMGIHGFFLAAGWSFGPLYGGAILDAFAAQPAVAWALIASLALVSFVGYLLFRLRLPREINFQDS